MIVEYAQVPAPGRRTGHRAGAPIRAGVARAVPGTSGLSPEPRREPFPAGVRDDRATTGAPA